MDNIKYIVKCNKCISERDVKYKSIFDKFVINTYLCKSCKIQKSISDRTRICPKCSNFVVSTSPRNKRNAENVNAVCKNCRSNQIPEILSYEQKQILDGLMLGDGSIVYPRKSGAKYPRLCVARQVQDKDYLFWQYNIFKEFYGTEPKYYKSYHNRVKKFYEGYVCRTKTGKIFKSYYDKWYPSGKKIVPKDLELTPLILLVWFLDDGCIVRSSKNGLVIKFSTNCFIEDDVNFLKNLLSNYIKSRVNVYKNGKGFILKASSETTKKIINIIEPIFLQCMERKMTWITKQV